MSAISTRYFRLTETTELFSMLYSRFIAFVIMLVYRKIQLLYSSRTRVAYLIVTLNLILNDWIKVVPVISRSTSLLNPFLTTNYKSSRKGNSALKSLIYNLMLRLEVLKSTSSNPMKYGP